MIRRVALAVLLLGGVASAAEQAVTLKISGWHSKGDALKAEMAVRAVKGVKSASADSGRKELAVVFDDAIATRAKIEKAVEDAGYTLAR